jgi:hypothetical protein
LAARRAWGYTITAAISGDERMSDQTHSTQLRRLKNGRCPIRGYGFGQIENYRYDIEGNEAADGKFCIAMCPRSGCTVRVTMSSPFEIGKLIAPTELVDRLDPAKR